MANKKIGGHRGNYRPRKNTGRVWKDIPELRGRTRNDGTKGGNVTSTRTKCVLKMVKSGTALREAREAVSSMNNQECSLYLRG